jgi:hypothetical protein
LPVNRYSAAPTHARKMKMRKMRKTGTFSIGLAHARECHLTMQWPPRPANRLCWRVFGGSSDTNKLPYKVHISALIRS